MTAPFDWDRYEKSAVETPAFNWEKYESPDISRPRSLISAPVKGLLKGAQTVNPIDQIMPKGPIPLELGRKLIQQFLPTQDRPEEKFLERAGELAPLVALGPEGGISKLAQLGTGAVLGEIARANDAGPIGQAVSEGIGIGLPGVVKGAAGAISKAVKSPSEKLPSGLTKLRSMDSKRPHLGIISPERQEKAISRLNEEASKLAKSAVEREVPILKKIEQGLDFEGNHSARFDELSRIASQANPKIDTNSLERFFYHTQQKYKGIPKLHSEGQKVVNEIKSFQRSPEDSLNNLLKIYRSNNKKIKNIYETSRLSGKQKEYVDFLVDTNKNIANSFENTLPADSAWLKEFKELNSDYKKYKNGLKTKALLQPIIEQKLTPASLEKFATDKKLQEKLSLAMGEKGAKEVEQIARDLKTATESLNKIPAKEFKKWEYFQLAGALVPHSGLLGTGFTIKKSFDLARRGYGSLLSTPKKRQQYQNFLKAIISKDKEAYIKASKKIIEDKDD